VIAADLSPTRQRGLRLPSLALRAQSRGMADEDIYPLVRRPGPIDHAEQPSVYKSALDDDRVARHDRFSVRERLHLRDFAAESSQERPAGKGRLLPAFVSE